MAQKSGYEFDLALKEVRSALEKLEEVKVADISKTDSVICLSECTIISNLADELHSRFEKIYNDFGVLEDKK